MIKAIKKNLTTDFIMCFLLLVISGNPIFIYSNYVREFYVLVAFLSFVYNRRKKTDGAPVFLNYSVFFIVIMLMQQIVIPNLSLSSQAFTIIRIFIGNLCVGIVYYSTL